MKKIGIDIDNTLTNIQEILTKAAYDYAISLNKKVDLKDLNIVDNSNDGNVYQKIFGFNYEELKYFLKDIQEEITNNATPRDGVVEVINKLHLDGYKIYIITARDSEFHDDPYKQSEKWLKKNKIYYDKLIVNARNKGEICNQEKIDIFIDDNISNCLEVEKYGTKAILINNECLNNMLTFNNWFDIYDFIREKVNKMYDYVLQLGFDSKIENYIQNLKNIIKSNGVIDKEKNWRPHITIDLYNCNDKETFINLVDEIVNSIKAFNLEFNNLNNFDNKTLYIEPFNKDNLYEIKNLFDMKLKDFRLENRKSKVYKPHVTLCTNDNLKKAISLVEDEFKPFVGKVVHLWIYNPKVKLIKEYNLD